MMVAIIIFFIIITATYVPYSYYQTKTTVKNEAKELAQALYESRNMAINGQSSESANVSIGIFFDAEDNKNEVVLFSYPYTFTWAQIIPEETPQIKILKKVKLDGGVQVDEVEWQKKALFFFESISWEWRYFYWDNTGNKSEFTPGYIDIVVSFKWASSENLQKIIRYYTHTNIIDY